MTILMIDNYCSFTFNQVHYLGELGADIMTERNDILTCEQLTHIKSDALIVSSGPCSPNEAGISLEAINYFAGKIPILGICLGHQCIGQAFGGKIIRAKRVMHGKTDKIYHQQKGIFQNLPNPFLATRYHSLVIDKENLPDCLEITAWTVNENGDFDEIMGVKHKSLAVEGMQFHPESFLTEQGHQLFNNFLNYIR